jgi:hypothetical protein
MAQTTKRGIAHDGDSTRNFQDLGKSLTSQNFRELLRPAPEGTAIPVEQTPAAPAPVAQQTNTAVPQPTARSSKE